MTLCVVIYLCGHKHTHLGDWDQRPNVLLFEASRRIQTIPVTDPPLGCCDGYEFSVLTCNEPTEGVHTNARCTLLLRSLLKAASSCFSCPVSDLEVANHTPMLSISASRAHPSIHLQVFNADAYRSCVTRTISQSQSLPFAIDRCSTTRLITEHIMF